MKVLSGNCSCELNIKGSKFLTEAFIIERQEDVRPLLKKQKEKYAGASHVVHAFVIGKQGEILGCSDDGEPAGTAGRPALNVLKGSGITNVLITITRWFGGTLLGTGGLVKAYSESVKTVLENAPVEELIEKCRFILSCSYAGYENIKRKLNELETVILDAEFSESVKITGVIPKKEKETFLTFITEATKGDVFADFPESIKPAD